MTVPMDRSGVALRAASKNLARLTQKVKAGLTKIAGLRPAFPNRPRKSRGADASVEVGQALGSLSSPVISWKTSSTRSSLTSWSSGVGRTSLATAGDNPLIPVLPERLFSLRLGTAWTEAPSRVLLGPSGEQRPSEHLRSASARTCPAPLKASATCFCRRCRGRIREEAHQRSAYPVD